MKCQRWNQSPPGSHWEDSEECESPWFTLCWFTCHQWSLSREPPCPWPGTWKGNSPAGLDPDKKQPEELEEWWRGQHLESDCNQRSCMSRVIFCPKQLEESWMLTLHLLSLFFCPHSRFAWLCRSSIPRGFMICMVTKHILPPNTWNEWERSQGTQLCHACED